MRLKYEPASEPLRFTLRFLMCSVPGALTSCVRVRVELGTVNHRAVKRCVLTFEVGVSTYEVFPRAAHTDQEARDLAVSTVRDQAYRPSISRNRRRAKMANVHRFRGGLVFKAHRLLYHSTLGLRVIQK